MFLTDRRGQTSREALCKLLGDNEEIRDSHHGPIEEESRQGNQPPGGDGGSELAVREKQPVPCVRRVVFDTILYNVPRSEPGRWLR